MYSLQLHCATEDAEALSFELWEAGTVAISESSANGSCVLTAGFDTAEGLGVLLERFGRYSPEWREDRTDWLAVTRDAWPGRAVGNKLFLAPHWSKDEAPAGRLRLVHNPGMASGTGEHPCTQLALEALETAVFSGCKVLDVGTGSGMLSIAALLLGAKTAVGIDPDEEALQTARENFLLNDFEPLLAVGSADCVAGERFDITVANISATVLLSIADDLLRVTTPQGALILTGFPRDEAPVIRDLLPHTEVSYSGDWACISAKLSLPVL